MPGAALWWRLAGRLQPAALDKSAHYLRPAWLPDLHRVFGTAIGETIAADPAFPRLVAAIDNADPTRWTPLDLLHVAAEHLRDIDEYHDFPLRPDEYAQLLTYSIDLFASDNPYDHYDIPVPTDIPLTAEEDEALRHEVPDPENPMHGPTDDAMLEMLGPGYGGTLIPPGDIDDLPPDPLAYATHGDDDNLTFEDLLIQRPLTRPVGPAVANVTALRAEYHLATTEYLSLAHQITNREGPAEQAAGQHLRELRARADRDRPHLLAVQDVMARWSDAEADYEHALAYIQYNRDQLAALKADPHADRLDIASAQTGIRLAMLALPDTTPAQQFGAELNDALARRAAAAGGPNLIVTDDDVHAARERTLDEDLAALAAARARRDHLRDDLSLAESATAQAFAEAETRNADHVLEHLDALHTELDMLRAAGHYRIERGFTIPPTDTSDLPDLTARAICAAARSGFTVTALGADDDTAALAALRVLSTAAAANDHQILWCSPINDQEERLRDAGITDTVLDLADLRQQIGRGQQELSTATTIIVDHAATADPAVLTDLAEHAADHHARLVLIDGDDHRWPPAPSGPLLKLLHHDLPWSSLLSIKTATPPRRLHQPDRDPLLEQADRCNPDILSTEVTEALEQRHRLRAQHNTSYRVHTEISRHITDSAQHRDIARER